PPRLPRRLKGVSGESVTRAVKDLHSHRRLLRPRRDWPRSRATTNYFDELAPSHCLPRGSGQGIVAAKTSAPEGSSMSALGQKRTSPYSITSSARLGRLEIDDQIKLGRLPTQSKQFADPKRKNFFRQPLI